MGVLDFIETRPRPVKLGPLPRSEAVYALLDKRKNLLKNYIHPSLNEIARRLSENSGRSLSQEVRVGELFVVTGFLTPREKII